MAAWQKLHQHRRGYRVLDAHRNADQQTQGEQHLGGRHPVVRQGRDQEDRRANEQDASASKAVGQPAAQQAAEKDADQCRGGHQPFPEAVQVQGG